ncbi:MAG TPA: polyhydroxyalkanoic acid system family protein [Gemmataceae bacterium]|nr:polyhydroxyalkanoic acid system family protein [Gemmataceae bacterium]
MPNLTISIPHQLGRAEAKRRLDELAANVQGQSGGMLQRVEQHWDGDTLHFQIAAAGQSISGTAQVAEQIVNLDIALPWILSMLAGTVKKQIERQAREVLEHRGTTT